MNNLKKILLLLSVMLCSSLTGCKDFPLPVGGGELSFNDGPSDKEWHQRHMDPQIMIDEMEQERQNAVRQTMEREETRERRQESARKLRDSSEILKYSREVPINQILVHPTLKD